MQIILLVSASVLDELYRNSKEKDIQVHVSIVIMISFPSLQSSPINSIQVKILKNILKHTRAYILANNCHYMYNYFIRKQNLEIKGCNVTNFHIGT